MTFIESDKAYGMMVGVWMLICIGGSFMYVVVTSDQRAESGQGPYTVIFAMLCLAIAGWMGIDYIYLPDYEGMPIVDFIKIWIQNKTG
jgi:hypothetical protein